MSPEQYQNEAGRTESPAGEVLSALDSKKVRLLHAALGISGEAGEIADAIKKHAIYHRELNVHDVAGIKEELGDLMWYVAMLMDITGLTLAEVMESNIAKLKARYPKKWSQEAEQNRDLKAEAAALGGAPAQA